MISVSRPLDYEQIPNGLIYLTVMAKDAGSPPLYSTVPVTIEVFVSIQEHWPYISRVRGGECFLEASPLPGGKGLCPHGCNCPKSCSQHIVPLLQLPRHLCTWPRPWSSVREMNGWALAPHEAL